MKVKNERIVLISDLTWGGAATACSRLLSGLRELGGVSVEWRACEGDSAPGIVVGSDWPSLAYMALARIVQRFDSSGSTALRIERLSNERAAKKYLVEKNPSLVNLHNIHEQMTSAFLRGIPSQVPIVWTLHDMWSLTGYCCYSFDCDHYLHGCLGECPQAGKWGSMPRGQDREWQAKQEFFVSNCDRMLMVAPSRWLADCAEARFDGAIRVEHVPYGLDLEEFKPVSGKQEVRRLLGLPPESGLVLVCVASLEDERKGVRQLVKSLSQLQKKRDITVVAVGKKWNAEWLPSSWVYPGVISDVQLMNLYYNAADVYVLSSLADNLPNTLIESAAAGTPCVTFDVGGCAEVVRDGETGYVAETGSPTSLAECTLRVLDLSPYEAKQMSQRCRAVAAEEYSLALQAERYMRLFNEVLSRAPSGAE